MKVAGVLAFFSMGVYNEEQKRETRPLLLLWSFEEKEEKREKR